MSTKVVKWAVGLIGVTALLVIVVLALPVQQWRTGEVPQPELRYAQPAHINAVKAARVWIDADPACGTGKHRDPDDCLALLSLAGAPGIDIAGISTVFGNAPVSETDAVMRALAGELGPRAGRSLPVYKGCAAAAQKCLEAGGSIDAQTALQQALRAGALDYVALGVLAPTLTLPQRGRE